MDLSVTELLARLARPPETQVTSSVRDFLAGAPREAGTLARAALGGHAADRMGWAFAAGYQAALARIMPDPALAPGQIASLAATESGGGHPRAIQTRLEPDGDGFRLSGEKTFATLGLDADVLLVVATAGVDAAGKNRLRVARVPAHRDGIVRTPGRQAPFVPEVTHAHITMTGAHVAASELLDGDGYDRVLKPFRTIEDLHVHAAVLGYLIAFAHRQRLARPLIERALAAIATLESLAREDPSAPAVHLALAGLLATTRPLAGDIAVASGAAAAADGDEAGRFRRDLPLLAVAEKVRELRTASAWTSLYSDGR